MNTKLTSIVSGSGEELNLSTNEKRSTNNLLNFNLGKNQLLSKMKATALKSSLKIAFSLLALVFLTIHSLNVLAQCDNTFNYGQYGSLTAPSSGNSATVGCQYAGEWHPVSGVVAGTIYKESSTVATDFITVRTGSSSGAVIAAGVQPLSWQAPTSGTYYVHTNSNSACGLAASCRDITMSNPGTGCDNSINYGQYGSLTAPTTIGATATVGCQYAGEYHPLASAGGGRVYQYTSTVTTDFITIRQGSVSGPIIASGVQPLFWQAPTSGTYYAHTNSNSACGLAASCRDVTITLISLPACLNPIVEVAPLTTTLCAGQSVVLTASGTATTYTWSPAAGLDATTGLVVTANPTQTTVYTVTGAVAGGCTTTATALVAISPAPIVVASANPATPCNGSNSQLNAAVTAVRVYHISSANIVNGFSNCGNGPYTCSGNVGFSWNDIGSGTATAISIQWGQGVECSSAGYSHSTTLNGVATPNFISTFSNCNCSPTTPPIYSLSPATTGYVVGGTNTFLVTSLPTCYGFQNNSGGPSVLGADYATVTVTYSTVGTTFSWSPATFLNSSTDQNPIATGINASTVYTVTATNPAGCSSTSTVAITIEPLVCGAIVAPTACTGSNFVISSNPSGGGLPYTYLWSNGTTSANLTDNQATAGSYTYTVTVTDNCGASCSSSVNVLVNQTPTASISPAGPLSTCANQPLILTASTSGISPTYVWMKDNSVLPGEVSSTLSVNASGSYSVVITDGGCSATSNGVSLTVNPIPSLSASSNVSIICEGDSAQLTAVGPPPTIAGYLFAQSTSTYTPITGGTFLSNVGVPNDDNNYGAVPIGFSFNYHGSPFTTLGVNANGYMQLGGVAPGSYYNGTSIQNLPNAIHAFSEDLYGTSATCEIQYITTGVVGSRVLTIQWKDWGFYSSGGNEFNFQVKLYEGTNDIQFVYQPISPATSQTLQVGLTGTTVADFNSRTTSSNWSATTASGANTNQMTWNTSGVVPSAGLTYTFSPPPTVDYSWSPAAGLSATNIANPKASPAIGTTIYTVTATAIGSGCTNTVTVSITNLGAGDPAPTTTSATECAGQIDHLAASGVSSLEWYDAPLGGNLMHIGANWDSVWTASATYWVGSNNGQCPSQRTIVSVTVLTLPLVNAGSDQSICPLDSVSIGSLALGNNVYYMRSSGGEPWGTTVNPTAMDAAFGSGNWSTQFFETAVPATILSSNTKVIFMEGSDNGPAALNSFITTNLTQLQNWVSSGGHLFINAGPNSGGNISLGFGGAMLNYPVYTATANVSAGQSGHPIFNGPALPVGTSWSGNSFGHATVTGGGATALIDGLGNPVMSELSWGAGKVIFGGMTTNNYHTPLLEAANLRSNILSYLNTGFSTGTYSWSPASGLSNSTVSNPMASPSSTTIYTVTITSALNGCTATDDVQVTLNPAPPTPAINSSTTFCGCGQSTLTATANGVGTIIRWYDVAAGGTILGTGSPFTTPVFCGAKTFYAEEFDPGTGCRSVVRASVIITPSIATAISAGTDVLLCSGAGPAVLTATSTNVDYIYSWSPAAGLTATTGASVSAQPTSTTEYIVTGTDTVTGCIYQDTVIVSIGVIPTVNSITTSNNNFCSGNSTQLNVSASLPGSVDDPGGECIPVFPSGGATDDYIQNFTFNTLSNLNSGDAGSDYTNYPAIGSNTTTVNAGSTYNISVQSGSPTWSEGFTVWIDYSRNGVFEPSEMVYQSAGTSPQFLYTGTVTIPPGTVTGTARMRVFCMYAGIQPGSNPCNSPANASFGEVEDYTINIFGSGPSGSISYSWSPSGSLSNSTIANPVATPVSTTTYTVTINDQAGCSTTATIQVNVNPVPAAPVTTNATVCGLNIGTVTATPSGGTIKWLPNSNSGKIITTGNSYSTTVGATTTFYAYEDPGSITQYVGLSATAPGAFAYASATTNYQTFDVLNNTGIDINTVDIVPSPATPIGTPVSIQLENSVGTVLAVASTVTTTQGAVQTITLNFHVPIGTAYRLRPSQNPNLQYHQSGFSNPYTIPNELSITGFDGGSFLYVFFYNWSVNTGCFGPSSPATITVNTPPTATITPSGSTTFCGSGTVSLTGAGGSYVNFNWSPAAGLNSTTGATVTANPTQTTTYTLTADDGLGVNGCIDTATITVTVYPAPFVSVASTPQDTICLGTSFNLSATAGSASVKQIGSNHNPVNNLAIIYNGGNASVRSQIIYTQAELNAAGLVGPTNILSIGFEVANKLSTGTYTGFTIKMAGVGSTPPLSGTYLNPAFTTVFNGNVTTALGWNTHVFTTPFAWDGVSNVVVDICNGTGPPFGFDQVYCTPTVSASAIDITTLGCSATFGAATLNRPNTQFTGGLVTYSWSPAVDISSSTISNPLYSSTSVGPKSYSVTVTDPATSCTVTASVNFVVSTTPKIPAAHVLGTDTLFCVTGIPKMYADGTTGSYQWQSSADGTIFSNVSGATDDTLIDAAISIDAYYRVFVHCGGDSSYSNVLYFQVNNPSITSVTNDTICGIGPVCLSATKNKPIYDVQWFASATGGLPVYVGDTFCTNILNTTTFYAQAVTQGTALTPATPLTTTFAGGNGANGNMFDISATNTVKIDSFAMFVNAGTATGEVWYRPGSFVGFTTSNAGWTLAGSINFTSSGAGGPNGTVVPIYVGVTIPAGQTYAFYVTAAQGNTYTNGTAVGNTLAADANILIKEGNGGGYFSVINAPRRFNGRVFYSLNAGCSSTPRIAVTAVSTTPPAISVTGATSICESTSAVLGVTSGNPDYVYTWNPGGLVGASQTVSPIVTTTYTVTAIDAVLGCSNQDTVVIVVTPKPIITSISATPLILCAGDSAQISVSATPFIPPSGNYSVASISYAPVVPITNVLANAGPIGDEGIVSASIGFNFSYYGTTYSNVTVHTNGYIVFAPYSFGSYSPPTIPSTNNTNGWVGFWADLNAVTGDITYETQGSAPFRKFIVNYNTVDYYFANPYVSHQIVLNETYNTIEVHMAHAQSGFTQALGMEDQTGSNGIAAPGRNSGSWSTDNESWKFSPPVASSMIYSWVPATGLSNSAISNPKASPATTTTYTVTVLETGTGCSSTESITIDFVPSAVPVLTPGNDTIVCSSSLGYYIHVNDAGPYSAGYPTGTLFEWINYTPPTAGLDSIFVNISDNYACKVYLPGSLGGCSAYSDTVFVDFGTAQSPLPFMQQDSVKCHGGSNGAAIAELVSGFVPMVNYKWYNSSNVLMRNVTTNVSSDTLKNVPIGWYYLYVYNGIGSPQITCIAIDSVEVFELDAIIVNGVVANAACYNTNTGSIQVTPVNGTPPYTYLWNNGATNQNRNNIKKGTYYVTVFDSYGCSSTASFTVNQPNKLLVNLGQVNIRCGGKSTGSVTANPIGGTAPFTYLWSNGQMTATISGLSVGTFTVIVTDANGCTNSNSTTVTQNAPMVVIVTPSPSGTTASASISGGVGPYTYFWNSVPPQTTSTATGLTPCHAYKVKVTDSKNCTTIVSFNTPCPKEIPALVPVDPTVRAYPNPTSGLLTVDAYNFNSSTLSIKLYDGIGNLVYNKQMQLENNSTVIDLADLPKGIYMMNVMSGNKFKTIKVVVQ